MAHSLPETATLPRQFTCLTDLSRTCESAAPEFVH